MPSVEPPGAISMPLGEIKDFAGFLPHLEANRIGGADLSPVSGHSGEA